jgi:plastocyanin
MHRRIHRGWRALAALSALLAAACGGGTSSGAPAGGTTAPVTNPVNPETAGAVTGTIVFEGVAPAPEPLRMSADPKCQPQGGAAVNESLLVGDGRGLQNVFVYVKDGLGNLVFPVPTTPVVLDQQGCHYVPHVFGVQAGQPVEIRNSDPTLHNVHAIPKANQEFNTGQPLQGMKTTHVFTAKEVLVPFKCDVHNWMNAYVGVLDHPFFAVTAADGAFQLSGLPPGTYTIEAVHEKLGAQTQSVTIAAKETRDVAFTFKS